VTNPHLTFFVELESEDFARLFADGSVEEHLLGGGFGLAVGILDLSTERAAIIRRVERRGLPVTAWLLLPRSEGYWLNADNAAKATERYRAVREWARAEDLSLSWVGLDIEFPRPDAKMLMRSPAKGFVRLLRRRRSRHVIYAAQRAYEHLVSEIHSDGRLVETYLLPQTLDERAAGTTLLRRTLGLIEVRADRAVYMLYTTHIGAAAARGYMPEAEAIAVGSTGGGFDADFPSTRARLLRGEPLLSDLRGAAARTRHLYVFSLEGCVAQGVLASLTTLDWSLAPAPIAARERRRAAGARRRLRALLRAERLLDLIHRPPAT